MHAAVLPIDPLFGLFAATVQCSPVPTEFGAVEAQYAQTWNDDEDDDGGDAEDDDSDEWDDEDWEEEDWDDEDDDDDGDDDDEADDDEEYDDFSTYGEAGRQERRPRRSDWDD